MSRKSTAPAARTVWRMSTSVPLGEIVRIDPAGEVVKPDPRLLGIDDWPETDWQASSYDLLMGCRVKDYTARIPDRVFNALFKDD
jgi:hypothetical protein